MTPEELAKLSPDELERYVNEGRYTSTPPQPPVQSSEAPKVETSPVAEAECGFDIADPVELLFLLDDDIKSGVVKLHDWQIQFMVDFAAQHHISDNPFQAVVRAANGSGKDKYIIAPCAVWLCMRYVKSRCVITSSSGVQLDNQTDTYIKQLCEAANKKIAPNIWKINYRYYECLATSSPMILFATDESGKAEGYHPLVANGRMAIFQSEAKTVPDEINSALNRCTGYTHRVHVSSPGLPIGHFYSTCCGAKYRKDMKSLHDKEATQWIQYHITAYDCSHLSRNYIEQIKRDTPGGEQSSFFKSSILAEFGDDEGQRTVISYSVVWRSANNHKLGHLKEEFNTAGLDLSLGGDETCLSVRNGNKQIGLEPFKFKEERDVINHVDKLLRKYDLNNPSSVIFADAGGLGKPMIQRLRDLGWLNIRYVTFQGKPSDERIYANLIAELWFKFGRLLESGEVCILPDDKLMRQLATRVYAAQEMTQKHLLESKIKARSKGRLSPDRADATVMSFYNYKSKVDFVEHYQDIKKPYKAEEAKPLIHDFSLKMWANKDVNEPKYPRTSVAPKDFNRYQQLIQQHNKERKELACQS